MQLPFPTPARCGMVAQAQNSKGMHFSPRTSPRTSPRSTPRCSTVSVDVLKAVVPAALHAQNNAHIRKSRPRASLRVLCYGDSNTAGFCSKGTRFEPYARSLEKVLLTAGIACEVSHVGLSGLTAAEMSEKMGHSSIRDICGKEHQGLRRLVRNQRPDLVIIMAGTNDIGRNKHAEEVLQHIIQLHDACHESGIPTIALAPPSITEGPQCQCRDTFAKMLQQWAIANPKVEAFRDAEECVPRGPHGYWEPDIIHLSPAGSWALGQQLGQLVAKCNRKPVGRRHTWQAGRLASGGA